MCALDGLESELAKPPQWYDRELGDILVRKMDEMHLTFPDCANEAVILYEKLNEKLNAMLQC